MQKKEEEEDKRFRTSFTHTSDLTGGILPCYCMLVACESEWERKRGGGGGGERERACMIVHM